MDLKVYQKETVRQPQGSVEVLKPGIIDIYPIFDEQNGLSINDAEILEGEAEITQACAMATIYQRGLDPIDLEDGVQWSEVMRGEITPAQLIAQLQIAVSNVSNTASITFGTVKDKDGVEKLSFELRAI